MFVDILAALLTMQASAAPVSDQAAPEMPPPETTKPVIFPLEHSTPQQWAEECEPWDDWNKPTEPFAIFPGVYYVGTCGITVLLVATPYGHVLIDAGTTEGMKVVEANLARVPVRARDIGLILASHEHFDHVGGLWYAQAITYAPVAASPIAARVMRTGEDDPRDPQVGMHERMIPAPNVIEVEPGSALTFANIEFTMISTPGHTPGAMSWHWQSCDMADRCVNIVYADSLSPVSRDDYRFSDHPEYVAEYRSGLQRLRMTPCDILLTPHPSASRMLKRAATGSFEGGYSCAQYADDVEKRLDARLEREAEAE